MREWKDFVKAEAVQSRSSDHIPTSEPVSITLAYLYEEVPLDVDNIIKPILDALVDLAYLDDSLITDAVIRRRCLQGTFDLSRVSPILIEGFEHGGEFVYVQVSNTPPQEQLI